MKINNINKDIHSVKIDVTVSPDLWKEELENKKKLAAKNVKVDGYRKGKVPYEIAIKHINMGDVFNHALEPVINKTIEAVEASDEFVKDDSNILPKPSIKVLNISENELVIQFIYDKTPEIVLPDYKKITFNNVPCTDVAETEVDSEIERIVKLQAKFIKKESGSLEKNDLAIIDFVGKVDGKEFPGGKSNDFKLLIGSKQFIDNFEDQLIGMNIGDTRTINVKFPENYGQPDLAGKKAEFEVKLNGIEIKTEAKLDDELIASFKLPDVTTVEQFRKWLKNQMVESKNMQAQGIINQQISVFLIENTKIDYYPESLVSMQMQQLFQQTEQQLRQSNMTFDNYLSLIKMTKEQFDQKLHEDAKKGVLLSLAIDEIIEKEKITVSDKDVDSYLEKIAKAYGQSLDQIKSVFGQNIEPIKESLSQQKTYEKIAELNKDNIKKAETCDTDKKSKAKAKTKSKCSNDDCKCDNCECGDDCKCSSDGCECTDCGCND